MPTTEIPRCARNDTVCCARNDTVCCARNDTVCCAQNGTVKEYINDGDYQVNIAVGVQALKDGVIVDEYPAEGIQKLREYFDEAKAITVQSKFLELFDIDSIVITEFAVVQATESNYQPISITALSDTDYNVYSTEY